MTTTGTPAEYSEYDHFQSGMTMESAHGDWDTLRAKCPVGWSDNYGGMWVVTGYEAAREVFSTPDVFSSSQIIIPPFIGAAKMVPIEIDPPDHRRYRDVLAAPFSPRHAELQEAPLRKIVNRLIDGFIEKGSCDIYQELALPFPTLMGTSMLGLPDEDAQKFEEWSHNITYETSRHPELAAQAITELHDYFRDLLADRRANPRDDVMTLIALAEENGERLNDELLMGYCLLLILASTDTSTKVIGSMCWQLATDVELRHRIVAEPDAVGAVVEEFLRLWAPSEPARRCMKDTVVSGVDMKAGDQVLVLLSAANRDDAEFAQPGEFVFGRKHNRHLAFGVHIHRCLGSHIARVELRVLLEEFLRRIPEFELQDGAEIEWQNGQNQGIVKVPIQFPPGEREESVAVA